MGKKIVVVNAGPRKGWNTDTMYRGLLKNYQETLNRFVGPTEVFNQE